MRSRLEEQLAQLNDSLIEMGSVVEKAISNATKALIEQDTQMAKRIIDSDDEIDNMEKEIERLCLKLILQQQPVASDLRLVSAILKIITDLERVGDHATDISELALYLADETYIKKLEVIELMAIVTMRMVKESIEAFVRRDIELARKVIAEDDEVDNLFLAVKKELIDLINKNVGNGDQALDLMMIAKYYERIGDHATNVAEWVEFALTGTYKDIQIM